jgi:hypothetical protein
MQNIKLCFFLYSLKLGAKNWPELISHFDMYHHFMLVEKTGLNSSSLLLQSCGPPAGFLFKTWKKTLELNLDL